MKSVKMSYHAGDKSLLGEYQNPEKIDIRGSKILFGGMSSTSQKVTKPISRVTYPIFYAEEIKGMILIVVQEH